MIEALVGAKVPMERIQMLVIYWENMLVQKEARIFGIEAWFRTLRLDPHSLYTNGHHLILSTALDFIVSLLGDNQASHAHPLEQFPSDCNVFYNERKEGGRNSRGAVKAYRSYAHRSDCDSLV
jgi:hypothetical protein